MRIKRNLACLVLTVAALALPSCATVNVCKWAYQSPSAFEPPDKSAEDHAIRAIAGVPLILLGVGIDAATFPFQILFGVWPWWGSSSTTMKPQQG